MFSLVKSFLGHVMPSIIRPLHVLWNQVIGFLFIVLALLPMHSILRDFEKDGTGPRLALEICFAALMGWFGIVSFWKARKISKS